jgi:biofilm PGA synthesis N-glycosyltransferase PgaC
MWFVAAEYVTSALWGVVTLGLAALWLLGSLPGVHLPVSVGGLLPGLWGVLLGVMFLIQVGVGMAMDRRYDPGIERYLPSMVSYPLVYWTLAVLTSVVALPRALLLTRGRAAVWVSPDRGVQASG